MTIGLLSIANPSVQAGAGLQIVLSRNASWASAPAWYESDLVWAAGQLMAACPNTNITVTITCGYTEIANLALGSVPPSSSQAGIARSSASVPYATIKSFMTARTSQPSAFSSVLANLPGGSSLGSKSSWGLSWAACKALGIYSGGGFSSAPSGPNDTSFADGNMGIGSGWSSAKTKGVFLHELSHCMGRIAGEAPHVFSRFTAAGVWDVSNSGSNAAYLSLDGGTTIRALYGTSGSDPGDFKDTETDPGSGGLTDSFDESQTNPAEYITPLDLVELEVMGFW